MVRVNNAGPASRALRKGAARQRHPRANRGHYAENFSARWMELIRSMINSAFLREQNWKLHRGILSEYKEMFG